MEIIKPAIFLDRDGVIIENKDNYVRSWNDVEFYPQALKALKEFANVPYYFVIITNQSAVRRGIITYTKAQLINYKITQTIKSFGGKIDRAYLCPHRPDEDCMCRKPKSGMLYRANYELNIDMKRSIMIGDAWTDLEAGWNAGLKKCALVKTGRGESQLKLKHDKRALIYKDLSSALFDLLK